MSSSPRKFYISRGLENILSKCNNLLHEENKPLLEKQLKKQSQILQKNTTTKDDINYYEAHCIHKKEINSPTNVLEIMNRACNFYEVMWNIKTSKLRVLRSSEERSILQGEIRYIKMKIDKLVEEMTLIVHLQNNVLNNYVAIFMSD